MENNSYSNADILNLFYIHGECQRIVKRTCRRFDALFPNLPPMNPRKFLRFEGNPQHGDRPENTPKRYFLVFSNRVKLIS